ncbi:MAG: hypothetical protein MUC35_01700 [Candidatus Margulisbacteria bacterium]|jgi:hypothetical protein|nr:hypothetical protein [Candidatus Margulisiibacteriota bacterium]
MSVTAPNINTASVNRPAAAASTFAPDSLTKEVKDILKATGYWPLVKNNVRQITLGADDQADADRRQITISTRSGSGKALPAWLVALKIVHEAAHVAWRGQNALTPDERNAYSETAAFTYRYQEKFGLPANAKAFFYERVKAEQAVKTADYVIRSGGDLEFYPTKPHPQFLAKEIDPAASEKLRDQLYRAMLMAKVEAMAVKQDE